mgnify:CR=1 FL=1
MQPLCSPWAIAPLMLLINVPFGYWRARSRKFSFAWFAAIHVPILFAIALRLVLGIAFCFSVLPVYVLAFAAGQAAGGWIRNR